MKQGKRPTRRQKVEIKQSGLNPENWLVERDTPRELVLLSRYNADSRVIRKGA